MITILCKSNTESEWQKNNPVLKYKEFISVVMPNKTICYKLGDGESHYKDLPFMSLFMALDNGYIYDTQGKPLCKMSLFREEQLFEND